MPKPFAEFFENEYSFQYSNLTYTPNPQIRAYFWHYRINSHTCMSASSKSHQKQAPENLEHNEIIIYTRTKMLYSIIVHF